MAKISPKDKARFATYVVDSKRSAENLSFLLENLGEQLSIDYSIESLASAEAAYWRWVENGMPGDLTDPEHFAQLLGQYLGECIIHHTGAKWVQVDEQNPMFAQPCIDGFGGKAWDRVYPVHTAMNLRTLPQVKSSFPGVQERRVLATKLERALEIHMRSQTGGRQNDVQVKNELPHRLDEA
jgi:hypothetical protein